MRSPQFDADGEPGAAHAAMPEAIEYNADVYPLTHEDRMSLMQIIDASLNIIKRHQFFSWSQGVLQFLVPHEILVCGMNGGGDVGMQMYFFSSCRYFNQEQFSAVSHPETGLLRHMMSHWDRQGQPCLIGKHGHSKNCNPSWLKQLELNELRNAAAHGIRGADGHIKSFFCFSRVKEPFPPQLDYFLHILTPFIDTTLSRVLAHEGKESNIHVRAKLSVTGRELQILKHLKDGRSNPEIAQILHISPHTVKNHVRKILHKLGVQSRAQAAVKAMQLGVLTLHREPD